MGPGLGAVDGLSVGAKPRPCLSQPLLRESSIYMSQDLDIHLKYWYDDTVLVWPHIHQEISPAADCDGELPEQLLNGEHVLHGHVPPVAPALSVNNS